jgi:uncharacterized protein YkwD
VRRLAINLLILVVFLIICFPGTQKGEATTFQTCPWDYCVYFPYVSERIPVDTTVLPADWLERFNVYRSAAGLPLLVEDAEFSADLQKHANYMLLNVPQEGLWHGETPGNPGYTPEGDQAARESNIWFSNNPNTVAATAIDVWMGSKGHRYGMLRPDLLVTGFAIDCDDNNCGTGLNVLRGLTGRYSPPDGITYPGANQLGVKTSEYISWQFAPYYGPEYADTNPLAVLISAVLYNPGGNPVDITTTTPVDFFNMITVTPETQLVPNSTYRVEILVTYGERQINRSWNFTTRE